MRHLLVRWLINTLVLYLAVKLLPGFHYEGGALNLVIVAAIFGLVNATLRPILTMLTCPLVLLTLGLFALVINGLMLLVTSYISERFGLGFHVDGFGPAFWGGLVIGLVSAILSLLVGEKRVSVSAHRL